MNSHSKKAACLFCETTLLLFLFPKKEMQYMKIRGKRILSAMLTLVLLICAIVHAAAYLWGDADLDGTLTAADARLVLRASAGLSTLDEIQHELADVDRDNKITAADARMVLRVSVGLSKITTPAVLTLEPQSEEEIRELERAVIEFTNIYRRNNGLTDLKENRLLSQVARKKSEDMLENQYFSHESPVFGSPFAMMQHFGVDYYAAGENIAKGYQTPEEAVDAWWESPGHKKNILSPLYKEIGVGYVETGKYWTQMFIG